MVVSSVDGQKRLEAAFDLGHDTAEAYALAAKIIYHIENGAAVIDIPEAYAEAERARAELDFKFFLHHVLNQPITAQDKSLINSLLRSITTGEYRQTYQFRSGSDVGREVDESTSEQQGGVVSLRLPIDSGGQAR